MWELVSNADKDGRMKLAHLSDKDALPDYHIYLSQEESGTGSEARYIIKIETDGTGSPLPCFEIEATDGNIDEIWLSIEASVLMYNSILEQIAVGALEYDAATMGTLYDHIVAGLEEYKDRGLVYTEMVLAAAYNGNDWLSAYVDGKLFSKAAPQATGSAS